MAISVGVDRKAELNVTPLIDVLLVLLIIFMVIAPTMSIGLEAVVPQPSNRKESSPASQIVISILRDGTVRVNEEAMAVADLAERLKTAFRLSPDQVVFVQGDKQLEFERVAEVIDLAKGAGLNRVALMTQ
jgi:biopolymer transport protein ExbD